MLEGLGNVGLSAGLCLDPLITAASGAAADGCLSVLAHTLGRVAGGGGAAGGQPAGRVAVDSIEQLCLVLEDCATGLVPPLLRGVLVRNAAKAMLVLLQQEEEVSAQGVGSNDITM